VVAHRVGPAIGAASISGSVNNGSP
jgi:hypothetical protein